MYLAVVGVCAFKIVRIPVLLMIINIETQHCCQSLGVSFYLPVGLLVVCEGEHIRNLEQLIYPLENFTRNFFIVCQ